MKTCALSTGLDKITWKKYCIGGDSGIHGNLFQIGLQCENTYESNSPK